MDILILILGIVLLIIGKRMGEVDGKSGKTLVLIGKVLIGIVIAIFLITVVYSCCATYSQRGKQHRQNEEQKSY